MTAETTERIATHDQWVQSVTITPPKLPPGSHMAVFVKEEGGTRGFLSVPMKHPELRTWTCDVAGDFAEAHDSLMNQYREWKAAQP